MSTRWTRAKLWMRSIAPVSSISDKAISTTVSIWRTRGCPPDTRPRPATSKASCSRCARTWNAGARPKIVPEAMAIRNVIPTALASMRTLSRRGMPGGANRSSRSSAQALTTRPAAPATIARTRLSVSIWRTRRPRSAPSAIRMAISRVRPAARTSSRLPTFAHAISNTQPTADRSSSSAGRAEATTVS